MKGRLWQFMYYWDDTVISVSPTLWPLEYAYAQAEFLRGCGGTGLYYVEEVDDSECAYPDKGCGHKIEEAA